MNSFNYNIRYNSHTNDNLEYVIYVKLVKAFMSLPIELTALKVEIELYENWIKNKNREFITMT